MLGAAMSLAMAVSVHAAGPTITIEPAGPLPDQDQTIILTGSGFDPLANGGVGIYVVFGPLADAPTFYTDAERYGAARWVHPGAVAGPGQAALEADGSFTTTLEIQPRYVDGHDVAVDCVATPCHVITMAAHGATDRSQDTFTAVTFGPASATPTTDRDSATWILPAVGLLLGAAILIGGGLVRRQRRPGRQSSD
jgi:hypothetical protein